MILLLSMAFGGCETSFKGPPDAQAVVWVSKLRRTVGNRSRLRVVPLTALRSLDKQTKLSPGRVLQVLGLRKRAKDPRRPYKVLVFQASSGALCRPVAGLDETAFVDGLPVCRNRESKASRQDDGCGATFDRANDKSGIEVYRASWRDLAPQGFCVMPLERFITELH